MWISERGIRGVALPAERSGRINDGTFVIGANRAACKTQEAAKCEQEPGAPRRPVLMELRGTAKQGDERNLGFQPRVAAPGKHTRRNTTQIHWGHCVRGLKSMASARCRSATLYCPAAAHSVPSAGAFPPGVTAASGLGWRRDRASFSTT